MKTKQIFIMFALLFYANISYSQGYIADVSYYLIEKRERYKILPTAININELYAIYAEIGSVSFHNMFEDYEECAAYLQAQEKCGEKWKSKRVVGLVQIKFESENALELIFDFKGNYFFKDYWYKRNDQLIDVLFKYFSDQILD